MPVPLFSVFDLAEAAAGGELLLDPAQYLPNVSASVVARYRSDTASKHINLRCAHFPTSYSSRVQDTVGCASSILQRLNGGRSLGSCERERLRTFMQQNDLKQMLSRTDMYGVGIRASALLLECGAVAPDDEVLRRTVQAFGPDKSHSKKRPRGAVPAADADED